MAWNICLVSDNEAIRHLFTRTFRGRSDISLKFFGTADEAINGVSEDSFHLMIVTVSLPDMDGYELCRELKDNQKVSFPILLMEDIFEDIDLDRCIEVNTDGFIAKPFEEELIAEKVDEMLQDMEPIDMMLSEDKEDRAEMLPTTEEEMGTAMMSAEEKEGIMDLTDLVSEEEMVTSFEEEEEKGIKDEAEEFFRVEKREEMPPAIASALEESASEMEAMEALEAEVFIGADAEEEKKEEIPIPDIPVYRPEVPVETTSPAMGMSQEEIEKIVSETVGRVVQKSLEEKLPALLRESFAKMLADFSQLIK